VKENKEHKKKFDFVRVLAISIILFHHLPAYTFNYYDLSLFGINLDLSFLNDLNRYLGLGLFVCLSGLLQGISNTAAKAPIHIGRFMLRKTLRIIPLYAVALGMFCAIIGMPDLKCLIVHVLGLQVVLASKWCEPMPTLWYIGLILPYYLIIAILSKFGNSLRRILVTVLVIVVTAFLLKSVFGLVDKRFFVYLPCYLFGFYLAARHDKQKPIAVAVMLLIILGSIFLYVKTIYPYVASNYHPEFISAISLTAFILVNIIMICFFLLVREAGSRIIIPRFISVISYSTFCMFLFHRPLWWLLLKLYFPQNEILRSMYLIIIGTPLLIAGSYILQQRYDKLSAGLSGGLR